MKNKIIPIVIIFIIILGIGGAAWWYISAHGNVTGKNPENIKQTTQNNPPTGTNNNETGAPEKNTTSSFPGQNNQPNNQNIFANDDFSFTYPNGWQSVPPPTGVSAMIVKQNETITDPQAKKMNFQSYVSVSYTSSDNKDKKQIIEAIKTQLQSLSPNIVFSHEQSLIINKNDAYAMEMNLNQSSIDFHILMALIWGKENDVWVISFNTLESLWEGYADTFGEISRSFAIK